MIIQWYPGHMTKAKREMEQAIKLVDLVIEIVDARVPESSRNPDIDKLAGNKARLILLNKADMSDPSVTKLWVEYFQKKGMEAVPLDSRNRGSMKAVRAALDRASEERRERNRRRGILNRPVRAMVAGIPNVGKSTFINSFAGKASAKTGNKPGVTKGTQWIRLDKNVELLDTPGILWPKFEDDNIGEKLALIGSVSEEVINKEELAMRGLSFLKDRYPGVISERYKVDENKDSELLLSDIAAARGCLQKGGETDTEKAARIILEEFRNGKICKISLEKPEENIC